MKLRNLLALALLFLTLESNAKDKPPSFKIDFLCCGEYVNYGSPAYSNAQLRAVLPYFSDFARKLDLPVHVPISMRQVERFLPPFLVKRKGQVGESATLKDGTIFGFQDGHVMYYERPGCYFSLQDPDQIPKYYGSLNMTQEEAVELARKAIKKLGYSLEDVLADLEPSISPLDGDGTNTVPHYRLKWLDPRTGGPATEVEIDANKKVIELLTFRSIVALKRPDPKVTVEPDPLPPNHPWQRMNEMANDINHEYAYRLVPVVFRAVEDWARKFDFRLPTPVTTNQVKRFYCSNNGGEPYVELTLTNHWDFVYRVNGITYARSPRRFFESTKLPFRVKDYAGRWNLTEAQAVEVARQTVAKFGYPPGFARTEEKPCIRRPREIKGLSAIPRLCIEWVYPDRNKPREQWIEVEVDCEKGTVEMIHFDDVRLWDKPPDLGVPITPQKGTSAPALK